MKNTHFRNQKLQDDYAGNGAICPAELCDIFECPEISEKILQTQTFKERTDGNYEGDETFYSTRRKKVSYLGNNTKKRKNYALNTYRYDMSTHYDSEKKANLLSKCHRLFLDCVDDNFDSPKI